MAKADFENGGVMEPPAGIWGALRYMGPGLILSAAIVGSGELVATTALGARAGFALLWVVLLGCVVKVAVQVEYGRQCMMWGETTFQAWNRGRAGGGWRGLHWSVWVGMAYMVANMVGQGGVLGGAAQVVMQVVPGVPVWGWVFLLAGVIGLILVWGRYGWVEGVAIGLNVIFVVGVWVCVWMVQGTEYRFSWGDLAGGFSFRLPGEVVGLAVAAFGITGVAAGEVSMYPYWCLEKGYARWVGERDGSEAWVRRARGWMRVMVVDAVVSMVVYTVATVGFYLLGASVLHGEAVLADGDAFVVQLSQMFTGVLGGGAKWLFLVCAFAVLFSTVFANTAGFSRVWVDCFGLAGCLDWRDEGVRRRWTAVVAVVFVGLAALTYLVVRKPLLLVTFMGISNALFLVVVGYEAVRFRYRATVPELRPGVVYDAALWVSLGAIGFMAWRAVLSLLPG